MRKLVICPQNTENSKSTFKSSIFCSQISASNSHPDCININAFDVSIIFEINQFLSEKCWRKIGRWTANYLSDISEKKCTKCKLDCHADPLHHVEDGYMEYSSTFFNNYKDKWNLLPSFMWKLICLFHMKLTDFIYLVQCLRKCSRYHITTPNFSMRISNPPGATYLLASY